MLRKFTNTLTDIGGYANAIMQSTDLLRDTKPKKTISEVDLTPNPTSFNFPETEKEEIII